ncbi:TRAP transporter small permease [Alloyangia pacifica]|uniref:TRAP transporter small permease n=1 Tax=Alloyangia pacifica TaxID=311180 RepID=UPI0034A0CE8A
MSPRSAARRRWPRCGASDARHAAKDRDGLISLSAFLGTLGLLFVVGVIVVDVIGRNFGMPLYGAQDLVIMTMVIIVFGGMALCAPRRRAYRRRHLRAASFAAAEPGDRRGRGATRGGDLRAHRLHGLQERAAEPDAESLDQPAAPADGVVQYALCALSLVAALALVMRAACAALGIRPAPASGQETP